MMRKRYNWISSSLSSNLDRLEALEGKINNFYKASSTREIYQNMIDDEPPIANLDDNSIRKQLLKFVIDEYKRGKLLEIGCGSGRFYNHLLSMGYTGQYTGMDLPEDIIRHNRLVYPQGHWISGSVYKLPFENNSFDACYSLYVLEHLIYPENAIKEMLRVTKPGGEVILVFPDFINSGRFPSQLTGYSPGNTLDKLKKFKVTDAIITYIENRFVLPKKLKRVHETIGDFPINIDPVCLSFNKISYDTDAVYISSKNEIIQWAKKNKYYAYLPKGDKGEYNDQAFVVIRKQEAA